MRASRAFVLRGAQRCSPCGGTYGVLGSSIFMCGVFSSSFFLRFSSFHWMPLHTRPLDSAASNQWRGGSLGTTSGAVPLEDRLGSGGRRLAGVCRGLRRVGHGRAGEHGRRGLSICAALLATSAAVHRVNGEAGPRHLIPSRLDAQKWRPGACSGTEAPLRDPCADAAACSRGSDAANSSACLGLTSADRQGATRTRCAARTRCARKPLGVGLKLKPVAREPALTKAASRTHKPPQCRRPLGVPPSSLL